MSNHEDFYTPEHVDEQVDALLQARGMPAQDQRMVHDLRTILENEEASEDVYSLQRVFQKLVENGHPAHQQNDKINPFQQRQKQERQVLMMKTSELSPKTRPIVRVFTTLTAALVAAILVASMLFVFNAAYQKAHTTTAGRGTATQTPVLSGPTGTIASQGATFRDPFAWSPLGNRIAGTDAAGVPATWDGLTGGNEIKYHMPFENSSTGVGDARWSPDGARVAFNYSNGIAVFNARTAALLESLPISQKNQTFQGLGWSPDGKFLVTLKVTVLSGMGTKNETLANQLDVWDLAANQVVAKPTSNLISNIAWSPDGRYLATWSVEGVGPVLTLWNPATWQIARTYSGVADFSWSPTGSLMAMVKGGSVLIVDTASGKVLRSFAGGNGVVSSVAWQPQGTKVLVGTHNVSSNTSYLSLWDTQTGTEVFAFKTFQGWSDGPSAWSSDGKYVLMSAFVGTSNVNLWKPTPTRSRASFYEVIWIA